MKLYYSPGACSLASHITISELGIEADTVKVDLKTHTTESGEDFLAINKKGYVPYLKIDETKNLSEGVAILQYLADLHPGKDLTPGVGTFERYQLQEWLTFISSELHKAIGTFFTPDALSEAGVEQVTKRIQARLQIIETRLTSNEFLLGETFTIADAYLFTILSWCKMMSIDISKYTKITVYLEKIANRPSVQAAMKAEGLLS